MSQEKLTPNSLVLAFTWHIPDNWYGTNKRVVLSAFEGSGFSGMKEAKQYKTALVKYIKAKFQNVKPSGKLLKFGEVGGFPTYIYCGAGPSYACDNYYVTVQDLERFIVELESSPEYQEAQRDRERRKEMKQNRTIHAEYRKMMKDSRIKA